MPQREELYYANGNFGSYYEIDADGRILDGLTRRPIGIDNKKKTEILGDYDTLANENMQLKSRLENIENLLEKYADGLPDELRRLIEKPPTLESMQNEISDLKSMLSQLLQSQLNERKADNDNNGTVPKTETKSKSAKGGGTETKLNGTKSEQSG